MPTLSPSQLSVFQLCEKRWEFTYKRKLEPKKPKSRAMEKGSYIHDLLHYYYELIRSGYRVGDPILLELIKQRISQDIAETENPDYKFFEECARTVANYISDRSPLIDSDLKSFEVEAHLEYELSNGYVIHGYIDLLHEKIRDHKTGTRNDFTSQSVSVNQQLMFYDLLHLLVNGILAPVEINWVHSNPPKKSKNPIYALVTSRFDEKKLRGFHAYLEHVTDIMLEKQDYLQNFSACGNCPFFHICDFELKGLDTTHLIENGYVDKSSKDETTTENREGDKVQTLDFKWGGN